MLWLKINSGNLFKPHLLQKKLSQADLVAFYNFFEENKQLSYKWDLWAAAYTIQGGCSDDGFIDFRAWLIMRGKTVFENAIADSDSLHSLGREQLEESTEGEEFNYVAIEVYAEKFNDEIQENPDVIELVYKEEPDGDDWEEDNTDDFKRINPKIFELFGDDWE